MNVFQLNIINLIICYFDSSLFLKEWLKCEVLCILFLSKLVLFELISYLNYDLFYCNFTVDSWIDSASFPNASLELVLSLYLKADGALGKFLTARSNAHEVECLCIQLISNLSA